MPFPSFKRVYQVDPALNEVQDNVAEVVQYLSGNAVIDGLLLTGIVLSSGSNKVAHKLNRKPLGWIVVDRNSSVTIYSTSSTEKFLNLTTSAAVTVSLWIF
jgi:hypothetical protein